MKRIRASHKDEGSKKMKKLYRTLSVAGVVSGLLSVTFFAYGIGLVIKGTGNEAALRSAQPKAEQNLADLLSQRSLRQSPEFRVERIASSRMTLLHYETDVDTETIRRDCKRLGEELDGPQEFRVYVKEVLSYFMEKDVRGEYPRIMKVEDPSEVVSSGKSGSMSRADAYIVSREGNKLSYLEKNENGQWERTQTSRVRAVRVPVVYQGSLKYKETIVFRTV